MAAVAQPLQAWRGSDRERLQERSNRSALGFRRVVKIQCRKKGRPVAIGKNAHRIPRPDAYGIKLMPPERPGTSIVLSYLQKHGIFGREVESLNLDVPLDVIQERLEFLESFGLHSRFLSRYPFLLAYSVKRNMLPVINYLELIGFTPEGVRQLLVRFPMILTSSVVVDLKPNVDYLLGYGICPQDIPDMLVRFPDVLGFKLEGTMSTSVSYLVAIGVRTRYIPLMLVQFPELLGMKVGNNIKPKVDFLLKLGLDNLEVCRLLEAHPYFLGYDLQDTLKPTAAHLVSVGIQERALPSMVFDYPDIFGIDLEEKIPSTKTWLIEQLLVSPSHVLQVLERLPQIMVIDREKVTKKLEFLKETGFTAEDLGRMVAECPQILAMSLQEALQPNMVYFQEVMRRPLSELVEYPQYLTLSLARRIKPRHRELVERRINCSLEWFLEGTDEKFNRRLRLRYVQAPLRPDSLPATATMYNVESQSAGPGDQATIEAEDFDPHDSSAGVADEGDNDDYGDLDTGTEGDNFGDEGDNDEYGDLPAGTKGDNLVDEDLYGGVQDDNLADGDYVEFAQERDETLPGGVADFEET